MSEDTAHQNLDRARRLIDSLVQHGVTRFIICPGSRSTPLVFAATEREDVTTFVHFDERGAAFHALGYARAANTPAAVITTSGTAVPNLMPATVEAANERLPLVLLTADRPPRLRHTGANQTIDQRHISGRFAHYAELDPASGLDRDTASRLLSHPVHINCAFDEPLLASPDQIEPRATTPLTTAIHDISRPAEHNLERCAEFTGSATNGLIIAGMLHSREEASAVQALASRLGWPLLPDITSGLRLGIANRNTIAHYDLILSTEEEPEAGPLHVLHIGGRFVSKRLLQWLQQAVIRKYWMISPFDEPFDPVGQVTDRIVGSVTPLCRALTEAVHPATSTSDLAWWQSREKATGEVLAEHLYSSNRLTGASVASRIAELTPANHGLFLASSLPVRLADWFAPSHGPRLQVAANRGASGIDGTVASAAGFAVGLQTPVTVLMGDQALLHDLNSLAMLNKIKYPVTVVVLNNGGGGIFDHLPIARHQSIFETYFVAAHEITFENAARQFGLGYSRPNSLDEFDKACSETLVAGKPAVIEVTTDRHTDLDQHRQILEAVKERLARE